MRTKYTKIRHKDTGRVFYVLPGTIYPDCYEEVLPDIRVGEPTIKVELEEIPDEKLDEAVKNAPEAEIVETTTEPVENSAKAEVKKPAKKPAKKKTTKGAKNANTKAK